MILTGWVIIPPCQMRQITAQGVSWYCRDGLTLTGGGTLTTHTRVYVKR